MLRQSFTLIWGLCVICTLTGCTLCFTPYDDHYNAFGGLVERQDRVHGRVGSILSDPALQYTDTASISDEATQEDLYPPDMPSPQPEMPSAEPLPPPKPEPKEQTKDAAKPKPGSTE